MHADVAQADDANGFVFHSLFLLFLSAISLSLVQVYKYNFSVPDVKILSLNRRYSKQAIANRGLRVIR